MYERQKATPSTPGGKTWPSASELIFLRLLLNPLTLLLQGNSETPVALCPSLFKWIAVELDPPVLSLVLTGTNRWMGCDLFSTLSGAQDSLSIR